MVSILPGILIVKQHKILHIKAEKAPPVPDRVSKLLGIGQPSSLQSLGMYRIDSSQGESMGKPSMDILVEKEADLHLVAALGCGTTCFFQCSTSVETSSSWSISC